MADVKLDGIFKKVETLIKNRLKFQVPVAKGTKKKPGGALKASIDVKVYQNDRGIQFKSSYAEYGKFTDEGTRPYWKGEQPTKKWKPNPGPGKKGIKPRYWTHLDTATMQQISKLVVKETAKQLAKEIINKK